MCYVCAMQHILPVENCRMQRLFCVGFGLICPGLANIGYKQTSFRVMFLPMAAMTLDVSRSAQAYKNVSCGLLYVLARWMLMQCWESDCLQLHVNRPSCINAVKQ